jgi:hypothetical protein
MNRINLIDELEDVFIECEEKTGLESSAKMYEKNLADTVLAESRK